ncbi:MAG: anthranilate synthase component I, partial [Solirubrobacterales bacterium]|nr:anthranilate synthase component I [Solirubrobacterales bacterium]
MAAVPELRDRLSPSLEEARSLAGEANVIPVALTFTEDRETPVSALMKLRGEGPCFLLESAERGQVGRYSFVGVEPRSVLRWADGELLEYEVGEGGPEAEPSSTVPAPDPYAAVADYMAGYRVAEVPGLPPFAGGAVGIFGYDLVRTVESLGEPNPDPLELPDLALLVTDALIAFDHLHNRMTILACAFVGEEGVDAAWEEAAGRIESLRQRLAEPVPAGPEPAMVEPAPFESNMEREEFEAVVGRIIEYIRAGDAFQVVPSQRFSADQRCEAFSIYRALRGINPSPYMYFIEFGDFQIAGTSPEPLLKVTGEQVEIRPIAGTAPRGEGPAEDAELAERLVSDPKERAEHVMLVDLARNDIGRVSRYGTVEVEELMVVEYYSHVMHIVSRVTGLLKEGLGALDVLRAALPAGTLSGAPKVRAME